MKSIEKNYEMVRFMAYRVFMFMYSDGGSFRAYRVFMFIYNDGGSFRAYRVFMFMYSDGGSFMAYRVFIKNSQDCTSHGIDNKFLICVSNV